MMGSLRKGVISPPRKINDCDIQAARVVDALLSLVERPRTNDRLTLGVLKIG
jgi:hypothetical protein